MAQPEKTVITPSKPLEPLLPHERIQVVDILRGFAIFGILVANMTAYSGLKAQAASMSPGLDRTILILTQFLIQAKFYSLFSFLFGWGMAVQMRRAQAWRSRFSPTFLRRMVILMAFGAIHGILIWSGDILSVYAIFGVVLLLFRKRSEKFLLLAVAFCLLFAVLWSLPAAPVQALRSQYAELTQFMRGTRFGEGLYTNGSYVAITRLRLQSYLAGLSNSLHFFGNVFAMFLLGLYAGKRRIFENLQAHGGLIRRILIGGFVVGVLFNGAWVWLSLNPGRLPEAYGASVSVGLRTLGAPALMLFYVALLIIISGTKRGSETLAPLTNVGRMALSNYLLQSIVATLIFYPYGLGLYGEIGPTSGLVLSTLIFFGQVRFSAWWFETYRYGPAEWLWRKLTYGRLRPAHLGQEGSLEAEEPFITGKRSGAQRLRARFNRHPLLPFGLVWVLLAAWGLGLLGWNARLNARLPADGLKVVLRITATPESRPASESGRETTQESAVIHPPSFEPAAYQPNPATIEGDIRFLLDAFDVDRALEQIRTLTGAPYYGRLAGSASGRAAGDYIAGEFARYGLQPAGEDGIFFQSFPIDYTLLADTPQLSVLSASGSLESHAVLFRDFSPLLNAYAGSGAAEAQVVWTGDCSAGSFRSVDVVDRIALCNPASGSLSGGDPIQVSARNAISFGAAGLLLLTGPEARPPDFSTVYHDTWIPEPIPAVRVYPTLVEKLLDNSGKTIEDLLNNEPPFELDRRLRVVVESLGERACPVKGCMARNVLGVLPGRDPAFADQVVVIGAHYDHMGEAPDGTVWAGANDNASGTAALLEIIRSWNEQGYTPRRTVLFAAWDAEELGLLGSRFYVKHPVFPLENTLGMLQMDMVGAGTETLLVGGHGQMNARVMAAAEAQGVPAESGDMGRSDHVPFLEADIPASLLIHLGEENEGATYHRPADTLETILPAVLEATGKIAELSLLNMVETEPALLSMLARRAEAAVAGDIEMFLASSHSNQQRADRIWLADLQALQPLSIEYRLRHLASAQDEARAQVRIVATFPGEADQEEPSVLEWDLPVKFLRGAGGWQWAGPDLQQVVEAEESPISESPAREQALDVFIPREEEPPEGLGIYAASRYAQYASLLGLPEEAQARILLFPDAESLRASTALTLPDERVDWVTQGEIKLVYDSELTGSLKLDQAIARLVLANAGLEEETLPWLWDGLLLLFIEEEDRVTLQRKILPQLIEKFQQDSIPQDEISAWAAAETLLHELGWPQLGAFIQALGAGCKQGGCQDPAELDRRFEDLLGMDQVEFEAAWHARWRQRVSHVESDLDRLIEARLAAIQQSQLQQFLATVDADVPHLLREQAFWFSDLQRSPVSELTIEAEPLVFWEDGRVLARIVYRYQDVSPGGEEKAYEESVEILFSPSGRGLKWSGNRFDPIAGELIDIRYPDGGEDIAQAVLQEIEALYPSLAAAFQVQEPERLTVTLYDQPFDFKASISLNAHFQDGFLAWTNRGEGIKLYIDGGDDLAAGRSQIVEKISRHLLHQMGVEAEWLLKGLSLYLSRPFDGGSAQRAATASLPELSQATADGLVFDFGDFPRDHDLTAEQSALAASQAWDSLRYFVERFGWDTLLKLVQLNADGLSLNTAIQSAVGISVREFQEQWTSSFLRGHASRQAMDVAALFEGEQAFEHVKRLTTAEMAGRRAGFEGADRAAEYIADGFQQAGLLPVGDDEGNPYLQQFSFTDTYLTAAPRLDLYSSAGDLSDALIYRQDFLPLDGFSMHYAAGELVWLDGRSLPETSLRGKIALLRRHTPLAENLNSLAPTGVRAVLLIGNRREAETIYPKNLLPPEEPYDYKFPVFELTAEGYSRFLDALGQERSSLEKLDSGQALDVWVEMEQQVVADQTLQTANVLGWIPGSDPHLKHEVILISAHYDHVGDDPDRWLCLPDQLCELMPGLRFSGANDDASGVGVLLELAHSWQVSGYRPKRSVLFAAWSAQELGRLGSTYFVEHPSLPFGEIVAAFQLDGVGSGDGFNLGVQADWDRDGWLLYNTVIAEGLLDERLIYTEPFNQSDQLTFRQSGIPAALFSWRLAGESNLPDGYANGVNPDYLDLTGRLTSLTLVQLAR